MGAIGGKVLHSIGKTPGGWATKIHAVVNIKGRPLEIGITEGQVNDNVVALEFLIDDLSNTIIADKAYDTNDIRNAIEEYGGRAVIPNQARRTHEIPYNGHTYKKRNVVERFFQRIKGWRSIATRYVTLGKMYLGMVVVACICFWLMY
jgi:transposase